MGRQRGQRQWRSLRSPRRSQKSTLQQLLATILALVMLLVFWNQLSTGAAGCFTSMTAPVNQQGQAIPPSGSGDADEGSATKEHDDRPTVRIQLPDGAK